MKNMESSILSWVLPIQLNCNELRYKCHTFSDLSDGVVIYELLSKM